MKLTDLDPRWVGAGGDGVYNTAPDGSLVPAPERHGVGVSFLCPCPTCTAQRTGDRDHDFHLRVFVGLTNPLDGGPPHDSRPGALWQRTGDTFEMLRLSPSLLSDVAKGGCGWHGYVGLNVPGEVTTC